MNRLITLIVAVTLLPTVAMAQVAKNLDTTISNVNPTVVRPGETIEITFNYTIKNNHTDPLSQSAPWRIRLDGTYYGDGIGLDNGTNFYMIVAGGQITFLEVHTVTIPIDTTPGTHFLKVWTSSILQWGGSPGTLTGDSADIIVISPEMMLADLAQYIMDEVVNGNIDVEMENSLLVKVDAALSALERDNPNDAKVAMNDLKALVNQVEAQTDKKITLEVAAQIIDQANDIVAVLSI